MLLNLKKLTDTYKKHSQLKKNVLSGTVSSAGNALINFIAYPLYLQYLGAEQYGLWTIITVVFTFSQFGQIGLNTAITKFVAEDYGRKDLKGITEYISTAIYILIVPSVLITCLLVLFRSQIADLINLTIFRNEGLQLIVLVGVLSVFSFFVNVIKGVVVGIGRMDIANYSSLAGRVLQILLNVIMLLVGYGIWSLYYGFVIFYVIPLIAWVFILRGTYNIKIFDPLAFSRQKMKELTKFGGKLIAEMTAQMFLPSFIKIIISRYIGLAEVAYYQIAFQLIITLRGFFVRGLESIMPKFSDMYGKGVESFKDIYSVHKKAMKFVYIFAFPLFSLIFIFSDLILQLWLGEQFNAQMTVALRILLIGWLINSVSVPDYFLFIGIGKVEYSVISTCIYVIASVILLSILLLFHIDISLYNVVLIESFGLTAGVVFLKYRLYEFKRLNRVPVSN